MKPADAAGELVAGRVRAAELLAGRVRGRCICTGACGCDPQPARCRALAGELRCELEAEHAGSHFAWTTQERGVYVFAIRHYWPPTVTP